MPWATALAWAHDLSTHDYSSWTVHWRSMASSGQASISWFQHLQMRRGNLELQFCFNYGLPVQRIY
jgi:hypothetical protein